MEGAGGRGAAASGAVAPWRGHVARDGRAESAALFRTSHQTSRLARVALASVPLVYRSERWVNHVDPSLNHSTDWDVEEDVRLIEAVESAGERWADVARVLREFGYCRSEGACAAAVVDCTAAE